jgi:hypothetical protein
LAVQVAPFACCSTQSPEGMQPKPGAQSELPPQVNGQPAPPLQTYGAQEGLPAPVTFAQLPVAQLWQAPHEGAPQQ